MASAPVRIEHLRILNRERLVHLCARGTRVGGTRLRDDTTGTEDELVARLFASKLTYGDLEFSDIDTVLSALGQSTIGCTKEDLILHISGYAGNAAGDSAEALQSCGMTATEDGESETGSGVDAGALVCVTSTHLTGLQHEMLRRMLGRISKLRVEETASADELIASLVQRGVILGDLISVELHAILRNLKRAPQGARTISAIIARIIADEPGTPKMKSTRPPRHQAAASVAQGTLTRQPILDGSSVRGKTVGKIPTVPDNPWVTPEQPPKPDPMERPPPEYKHYRKDVKFLAMFNHKGGVGKTTAALQYGYAAAAKGLKTIVIDADSQGSAGTSALRQMMEESGHTFHSLHATLSEPSSFGSALLQWSSEHGLTPASAINLATFSPQVGGSPSAAYTHAEDSWLKIVPGDSKLVVYEDALSQQLERLREIGVDPRKCAGAFTTVALMTAHHYKADLVIFDLSPTFSRLNRIAIATCDFWIMPCNAEMTVIDSVDMLRRIMTPRHRPRVVGGDIALYDDIEEYSQEQHSHTHPGPYPLPSPSSVLLGTIVSAYNNVADGLPSMTVRGTISRLGQVVNELRGILNDFATLPGPPVIFANGAAVPLPAVRAGAALGAGAAYLHPLLGRNFSVTDDEVAAAAVSGGFTRETLCISMMPNFTSLNSVGATLGVPVPFLDINRVRNLCDWSARAKKFYKTRSRDIMFPLQDDYAGRIEMYNRATKAATEDILRLMVRVCHRQGADALVTAPQLLQKMTALSGSAVPFRQMTLSSLPPGPYMVCPFDTCLNLGALRPAISSQTPHPEELQWLAYRNDREVAFTASLHQRR